MNSIQKFSRADIPLPMLLCLLLAACQPAKRASSPDQESLGRVLNEMVQGSKAAFLPPECLGLLAKENSPRLPSSSESAEAVSTPSSFHAMNREYRFDHVFLRSGPVCAPLRDHLLESPVWVLSQVRPEGYLFTLAGNTPWHAPDATEAARLMPDPDERSSWLIATAVNLIAIGHGEEASDLLGLASCSKKHQAERLAAIASLEASYGHWHKVLDLAGQSLGHDKRNRMATVILIRALAETGHSGEALDKAREFVLSSPDAESLFLLARAANAAGDHAGEIEALRRLVIIARQQRQPAGASLLYLGQALARDGQRGEALRALEESERAPELSETQKSLIRELRDHLAPEKE